MTPSKQNLLNAMRAFIRQRSGMDPNNYGSWREYESERRSITRDLAHAQRLLDYVAWHDSITADDIVKAASRRLTIKPRGVSGWELSYCTGQYFPTEYRKAAAAVLASAIWDWWRKNTPAPTAWRVESWDGPTGRERGPTLPSLAAAELALAEKGGHTYGRVQPLSNGQAPGDYLRTLARREFGRAIASRYFN